jgi:hypothetical protein
LKPLIAAAAAMLVGASAFAQTPLPPVAMSPAEMVAAAAAAPSGQGKRVTVAMLVQATGVSHGHVFLNSELDYRDPRNLSINIDIAAAKQMARQYGSPPDQFFKGKRILVSGTARRVPIVFLDHYHHPTGQYYFQTHVWVRLLSQIRLAS